MSVPSGCLLFRACSRSNAVMNVRHTQTNRQRGMNEIGSHNVRAPAGRGLVPATALTGSSLVSCTCVQGRRSKETKGVLRLETGAVVVTCRVGVGCHFQAQPIHAASATPRAGPALRRRRTWYRRTPSDQRVCGSFLLCLQFAPRVPVQRREAVAAAPERGGAAGGRGAGGPGRGRGRGRGAEVAAPSSSSQVRCVIDVCCHAGALTPRVLDVVA